MSRLAHLRWRLARWIAPTPIIAAPSGEGPRLLIRGETNNYQLWLEPRSLDIKVENVLSPLPDPLVLGTYAPSARCGSFSGTL